MLNENSVLPKVLWPLDKTTMLGTLSFDKSDFESTVSIAVNRHNDKIEILYSTAPIENIEDRTYFVKLYLEKKDDELNVNLAKSSPEIKNDKDIQDIIDLVHNTIIKMNVRPSFFPTGVVKPTNTLKM